MDLTRATKRSKMELQRRSKASSTFSSRSAGSTRTVPTVGGRRGTCSRRRRRADRGGNDESSAESEKPRRATAFPGRSAHGHRRLCPLRTAAARARDARWRPTGSPPCQSPRQREENQNDASCFGPGAHRSARMRSGRRECRRRTNPTSSSCSRMITRFARSRPTVVLSRRSPRRRRSIGSPTKERSFSTRSARTRSGGPSRATILTGSTATRTASCETRPRASIRASGPWRRRSRPAATRPPSSESGT